MKNIVKLLQIVAFVALIGFLLITCDSSSPSLDTGGGTQSGGDGGASGGDGSAGGPWGGGGGNPPPPILTAVAVTPPTPLVPQNETMQFSAAVIGTGNVSQSVTWAVENNNESLTTISTTGGLLTIAPNETATLTVRATSTANPGIEGTATVRPTWGPPGTENNPFQVWDEVDLRRVGTGLTCPEGNVWLRSAHYRQMADITLPAVPAWVPIGPGPTAADSFIGTFDGGGHTITNLTINSTTGHQGMFGFITAGGTVRNVRLVGGSISGGQFVGGLVGAIHNGFIVNSSATVDVSGGDGALGAVGGLAGQVFNSSITNSSAAGNVSGGNDNLHSGGLAGSLQGSSITNSFATGNVSGSGRRLGGLVGELHSGSITNSFATGDVSAGVNTDNMNAAGGLVGFVRNSSSVTNSFATGDVSAGVVNTSVMGGLVGQIQDGSITNSFATGDVLSGIGAGTSAGIGGLVGLAQTNAITTDNVALNSTITIGSISALRSGRVTGREGFTTNTFSNNHANSMMVEDGGATFLGIENGADVNIATLDSFWWETIANFNFGTSNVAPWQWCTFTNRPKFHWQQ